MEDTREEEERSSAIRKTLDRIKGLIEDSAREDVREELLALLSDLRLELGELAESRPEAAAGLAGLAHRAARGEGEGRGIEESLREFRASHPGLVAAFDAFCRTLSDAGV